MCEIVADERSGLPVIRAERRADFSLPQYCSDFSETSWYQRLRVPILARIFQPNVFGAASIAARSPSIRPRMMRRPSLMQVNIGKRLAIAMLVVPYSRA